MVEFIAICEGLYYKNTKIINKCGTFGVAILKHYQMSALRPYREFGVLKRLVSAYHSDKILMLVLPTTRYYAYTSL